MVGLAGAGSGCRQSLGLYRELNAAGDDPPTTCSGGCCNGMGGAGASVAGLAGCGQGCGQEIFKSNHPPPTLFHKQTRSGWKTREGRPRLGGSAPRHVTATTGRQRRGVVPAELAATRDMRAMVNWPGLLELLEEEGVQSVPTDGVRYWLARLGAGFQVCLGAGVWRVGGWKEVCVGRRRRTGGVH